MSLTSYRAAPPRDPTHILPHRTPNARGFGGFGCNWIHETRGLRGRGLNMALQRARAPERGLAARRDPATECGAETCLASAGYRNVSAGRMPARKASVSRSDESRQCHQQDSSDLQCKTPVVVSTRLKPRKDRLPLLCLSQG